MAYDFPNSPTIGQIVTGAGSQQWQWDGVKWSALVGTYAGPPPGAIISATPPSFGAGSLWWDTNGAQLYVRYDDGTSVQWVPATSIAQLSNAATQTDVLAAQNNVGRNLLHNPLFNIAQRGTGAFTAAGYTADRWNLIFANGSASVSIPAFTDGARAQIGDEAAAFAFINNFAGSATVGSYCFVSQVVESVKRLSNKTVIVSFWAAAISGTPKLGVSMDQYFGTGGSPSATVNGAGQSVTLSTMWTRYTLTFTLPSVSGKVLGIANNDSTYLNFWYSAEATFATRSGSVGVQTANIQLWGVQLEIAQPGQTQPTPLEKPDPQQDLAKCQRFYQGGIQVEILFSAFTALAYASTMTTLAVTMRATPTLVTGWTTTTNTTAPGVLSMSGYGFLTYVQGTATGVVTLVGGVNASADL